MKLHISFLILLFITIKANSQTIKGCRVGYQDNYYIYDTPLTADSENGQYLKIYSTATVHYANYTGFTRSCSIINPTYVGPSCKIKRPDGSTFDAGAIFEGALTPCATLPLDDYVSFFALSFAGFGFLIIRNKRLVILNA